MRPGFMAVLSGVLAASPALAAPNDVTYIEGKTHEKNGARWSDRLSRREPGYKVPCVADTSCVIDALVIRNDSDGDIRCAISVVYPQPNDAGIADVAGWEIIAARSERSVVHALDVPLGLAANSFGSDCTLLAPLPALDTPETCVAKIGGISPGDFYPPGSIRRNEQGTVVVEFTLTAENGKASDIAVVRGSEHEDLDAAALKLFGRAKFTTDCPGKRFRKNLPFLLRDN